MKKNIFFLFLVFLLPLLLFAEEAKQATGGFSIWNFLLTPKYIFGFILTVTQIIVLFNKRVNNSVRVVFLFLGFIFFGIYFPLHPSPICAVTKPIIYGFNPPFVAGIIFLALLSIVVSKGFCGTICPAGVVQELLYRIPILKNLKKKRVSFFISNTIRIAVALLFLLVVLTTGITVFAYFNLFELFHWSFDLPPIYLTIFIVSTLVILSASLILFRPFCYFVCPVGLITWLFEQTAPVKVRYDETKCNNCNACVDESPCPAVPDMLNKKKLIGDCHLCGICLNSCSENAFYFGTKK